MEKGYSIIGGDAAIQGSKPWLDFRKGKISASMAPVIMGESPFITPLELWESIIFDAPNESSPAMQRGTELEPKAREWSNRQLDMNFWPVVVQSVSHPNFIASLDGYTEVDGKPWIMEIKCPGRKDHELALSGEIPKKYYAQLQHQMYLLDVASMFYVSFDGENGAIVQVSIDTSYCKELFAKEQHFLSCLINMVPPEPCERDWAEVSDESLKDLIDLYRQSCANFERAKINKDDLKDLILARCCYPRIKVGGAKIQKVVRKGEVDYPLILEDLDLDVDVEAYRKPSSSYWKINIGAQNV